MGKNIGWWILGLFGVGAVGYLVFRPSAAQAQNRIAGPIHVGPCTFPANSGLTQADLTCLQRFLATAPPRIDPSTHQPICHHDLLEGAAYYAQNRASDGSITVTGTSGDQQSFPSFCAMLTASHGFG